MNDYSMIDYTLLKPTATDIDIFKLCCEAKEKECASVCIPSSFISKVKGWFKNSLTICTVVGFPLGNCSTETKVEEALTAIEHGADEIDMVVNISAVKSHDWETVIKDIKAVRAATMDKTLKVIIETCYLTTEEKIKLCKIVTMLRADFIKTSTGFGTGGATLEDVQLMREYCGDNIQIKASGGVRTREEVDAYLKAGCTRIGMSKLPD